MKTFHFRLNLFDGKCFQFWIIWLVIEKCLYNFKFWNLFLLHINFEHFINNLSWWFPLFVRSFKYCYLYKTCPKKETLIAENRVVSQWWQWPVAGHEQEWWSFKIKWQLVHCTMASSHPHPSVVVRCCCVHALLQHHSPAFDNTPPPPPRAAANQLPSGDR